MPLNVELDDLLPNSVDTERCDISASIPLRGLAEVLRRACPDAEAEIMTFGNPVAAVGLVAGLAAEDLDRAELGASDPRFAVIAAARVRKPEVR